MSISELLILLQSKDFVPFWDEVEKIKQQEFASLMKTEDPSYVKSLKVIDKIIGIPLVMKASVEKENRK